jgi:hypothetical protein
MTVHRGRNEAPSGLRRGGDDATAEHQRPICSFGATGSRNVTTTTGAGEQHT